MKKEAEFEYVCLDKVLVFGLTRTLTNPEDTHQQDRINLDKLKVPS